MIDGEQHNHHCALTCAGRNWWIVRKREVLIDLARPLGNFGVEAATVDTKDVDWNAYCKAARAWDERRGSGEPARFDA